MQVKSRISIDLRRRAVQEVVNAVQNDSNTRVIELQLFDGGTAWTVPAGTTIALGYRKADGKKGVYDTLPNGQKACTFSGSTVTIILAKQVLTTPGMVDAVITMHDAVYNQLSTIPFSIRVHEDPAAGAEKSEDYYSYTSWEDLNAAVDAWFREQDQKIAETLDGIKRVSSPAIVEPVLGEVITVSDASDLPLAGLKVFGKTTQNGTPTPETPVPLESVGDVTVTVAGKNLARISNATKITNNANTVEETETSVTFSGVRNSTWESNRYTYYLPKGTYTFSAKMETDKGYLNLGVYTSEQLDGTYYVALNLTESGSKQFTMSVNGYVQIRAHFTGGSGTNNETWNTRYYDIQLEKGYTATDFEESKIQDIFISTPNGLPGIPVESGGNYTDSTGKQWLCDEVDFEKGVYVQRVNTRVFDGTENWKRLYNNGRFGLTENWGTGNVSAIKTAGISTHYNWNQSVDTEDKSFRFAGTADYTKVLYLVDYNLKINASDWVNDSTAVELKEFLAEQYAKGTPVTIKYILTEEKPAELSPDQLAAFAELHSNYPNTTVFNDKNAGMEVKYVADTKLYIDKKFNELAAALVSNV